jgi:hypothetical protein
MMKSMALDDLLNVMWSALQIGRGSDLFFNSLEEELVKRIRGIKDDQFEQLIGCFVGEKAEATINKFSKRFLQLILRVLEEKKEKFHIKTLVSVIWAFARIDF